MSEQDKDWDELARRWQATELPESDVNWLQANLRRKRRGLVLANLMDGMATVALLAFMAWVLGPEPQGYDLILVFLVLAMLAFVWVLTLWNRRDGWRAPVNDLREGLAWSLERCRRQRRTIVISWAIYLVQVVVVVLFMGLTGPVSVDRFWNAGLILAGLCLGVAVWGWLYERRISREEQRLRELQKNFNGDM